MDSATRELLRQRISETRRAKFGNVDDAAAEKKREQRARRAETTPTVRPRKVKTDKQRNREWRKRHKAIKIRDRWIPRDREIVRRYEAGERQVWIAESFGLHPRTVGRIIDRHLPKRERRPRPSQCNRGHADLKVVRHTSGTPRQECRVCKRERQRRYLQKPEARAKKQAAQRRSYWKQREAA